MLLWHITTILGTADDRYSSTIWREPSTRGANYWTSEARIHLVVLDLPAWPNKTLARTYPNPPPANLKHSFVARIPLQTRRLRYKLLIHTKVWRRGDRPHAFTEGDSCWGCLTSVTRIPETVSFKKLIVAQLAFHGAHRFNIVFARPPSWAGWFKPTPSYTCFDIRRVL
jgi:hypothetical protein